MRDIDTRPLRGGWRGRELRDDRMFAVLTIACPKQPAPRGAFLEIPKALLPLRQQEGMEVGTIVAINGEAFAGFVDRDRRLVYLHAPPLPPNVPGMKIGTSVRAALTGMARAPGRRSRTKACENPQDARTAARMLRTFRAIAACGSRRAVRCAKQVGQPAAGGMLGAERQHRNGDRDTQKSADQAP
jgi:hypothetical protein